MQNKKGTKREHIEDMGYLYKFIKPYLKYYFMLIPCVLLTTGLLIPMPLFTRYLVDVVIPMKNMKLLNTVAFSLLGLFVVRTVVKYITLYLYAYVGHRINIDIRESIYKHVQNLPFSYLDKQTAGGIVSRIMNDVSALNGILTSSFFMICISNFITLIVSLVILFALDWKLTLINLACVPLYCFINHKFNSVVRLTSKRIQEQSAAIAGKLTESVSNQKIIRIFNSQNFFLKRFVKELETLMKLNLKGVKYDALVQQLTSIIGDIGPLVVLWYGVVLILRGNMTVGGLIAFYQYLLQIYAPINNLSAFNMYVQSARGALSRIVEFSQITTDDINEGIEIGDLTGEITLKNISFSYDSAKPVLDRVSLKIKPREFIGVVGPSGSGKTTLVNILTKFYKLTDGEIAFDNYSINDIQTKALLEHIGLVTQEPYLFRTTFEENIKLGNRNAAFEDIRNAARLAQIDDFIMSLPEKYDTIVDEKGVNLSGGQKQRISLARVFVKNPRIVIFDEATSSLDSNLEKLIQTAVEEKMRNTTCIVIAHRLSAVKNADRIIVMDNGKIVEEGKHMELINKRGLYFELYRKQMEPENEDLEESELIVEKMA